MNKIIICITTYNRPEQISALLQDLINQDNHNFSLVLLNDGANKKTCEIFNNINLPVPHYYFESKQPSGLPAARNKIIDYIEAQKIADEKTYLAFLDDDLIIDKNFVSNISKYSEKYDGFCFRIIQKGASTTFDFTKCPKIQKLLSPLIGKMLPLLGMFFGGFYIPSKKIQRVDHINGGCLIYNFSKNKSQRFDMNLNEGNFVAEDTCFSYGLTRVGNKLYYISNYSYIHNPPSHGGCKIEEKDNSFFWYWKHKLYIIEKYHGKTVGKFAKIFSFLESILLSLFFRKNLTAYYFKALSSDFYDQKQCK